MTHYIKGCDYGSVDENPAPKFGVLRAAGYGVVGIRAAYYSNGGIVADHCFVRDAAKARAAGMTVIPYYFPSFAVGAQSAADQVAAAFDAAAGLTPKVDLPLCLDIEWGNAGIGATGHTPAQVFALVMEHLHAIVKRIGCASAYTSQNEWYDMHGPSNPLLTDVFLWVKTAYRLGVRNSVDPVAAPDAHVGDAAWDPHDYHRIPDPWVHDGCWLEQTQGDAIDVPGIENQADINRFRIAKAGDHGPHVRGLQRRLKIPLTDTFDAATDAAVRALQTAHNLVVDGEVGPKTIATLWWP